MTPISNDNLPERRKDDFRMGQMLAILERIDKRQEKMEGDLSAVLDGTKKLPQCRENEKRIDDIEKKNSQHSYNGMNMRLESVEKRMDEQKAWNVWAIRSAAGAAIVGVIHAFRDRIFH